MSTLYGFYFDLYSKPGKLLRAGQVYANTLSQIKINSANVFWVVTGKYSDELVTANKVVWIKADNDSTQNKHYSEKFACEFEEYVLKYHYVKTRAIK
jgi:Tfp pilus assembly protein PilZ